MHHEYNKNLLAQFDIITQDLLRINPKFKKVNSDIFEWKNHEGHNADLIINCCTHGNETIGLDIIIDLLKQIEKHTLKTSLNIIFSLGNREAVLENKRFLEKDLNRSFSKTSALQFREEKRARELESIAKNAVAILDIHQTTSDSLSPFFVLKEIAYNYNFFNALDITAWPIILYKEGSFSKDGEAYSSFAMHNKIPFITIELGLAGPNIELQNYCRKKLGELLSQHNPNTWKNILENTNAVKPNVTCFREFKNIEKLTDEDYLTDGLKNLSLIEKSTIYAYQKTTPLSEVSDVYALFPKYGVFRKTSSELVRLLKKE